MFWLVVGLGLMVVAVVLFVLGMYLTKSGGEMQTFFVFVFAFCSLWGAAWVLGNVADLGYGWLFPLVWFLNTLVIPFCAFVMVALCCTWIYGTLSTTRDISIHGHTGIFGAHARQWDYFALMLAAILTFLTIGSYYVYAAVVSHWGAIPSLTDSELKRIQTLTREINEMRRDAGRDEDQIELQRNPHFKVTFKRCDISDNESAKHKAQLQGFLGAAFLVTDIQVITFEAPHSGNHKNGYALITACISKVTPPVALGGAPVVGPAFFYTYRTEEVIGSKGVQGWAKDKFEAKLVTIHEAEKVAAGSEPTVARHILRDRLNGVTVGGDMDNMVLVPATP